MLGVGPGPVSRTCEPDGSPSAGSISAPDRAALAVLASVHGLGPVTLARLCAAFGSPAAALDAAKGADGAKALVAATIDADGRRTLAEDVAAATLKAARDAGSIIRGIDRLGLRVVAIGDREYPARLRAIEIPPIVLFVRGDPRTFAAERAVAVVGTRRPTEAGRRTASRIAGAIARADGLVVSGLAVGIDGAAHAAAVHEGRPTVAFIGSGHARLFPQAHGRLADAIVDGGGAVVSEYSPDTEPTRGTFPRRNRLISGSADAVVVVEAGARSGALLTASWALEQGRECFVVPGPIDAPASAGCLGFLRDWPGLARVVSGVPQLLEDLGLAASAAFEPRRPREPRPSSTVEPVSPEAVLATMPPPDRAVGEAVLAGAEIVDEIVAVTGQSVGAVLGGLTRLETAGVLVARHGRYALSERLASRPGPHPARSPRKALSQAA